MILQVGEVREVGFEFNNSSTGNFIIDGADYAIVNGNAQIIQTGNAQVDGRRVLTLFNANDPGYFTVKFTVHIGPEIYKPNIPVRVK